VRVIYSTRAIADLIDIADYLKARSPAGARAVELRIHRTIALLEEFPGAGRELGQRPQVRVMPLGRYPYLVFYTVSGEELTVLHVRHGARQPVDPESL
jgi:plasmid stabilization system protein ParE